MSKDYYSILGVSKSATQDEIKKAYRKLAHKYHPDKEGGDEQKFKEINEAYQVLGNKEKRAQYDQFGTTFDSVGFEGGQGGKESGFNWQDFAKQYQGFNFGQGGFRTNINFDDFFTRDESVFGESFGDLGDLFGDFFGFSTNRRRSAASRESRRGEDIELVMTIDFREAVFGAEKIIRIEKMESCQKCDGKGYEAGTKIITCPQCNGRGKIQQTQRTFFGVFTSTSVCPTCKGEGKKPEKFCSKCHGDGRVKIKKEIKIKIPAGISEGETIKISGQGNSGLKGSKAGDLYISFKIKPDKEFKRDGYDILSQTEINIAQAALGDKIIINTLDGPVRLKIPAGTQSGKIFILKGKGVPILNKPGQRGNHLVKVIVRIPERLSKQQKKLLEELGKTL